MQSGKKDVFVPDYFFSRHDRNTCHSDRCDILGENYDILRQNDILRYCDILGLYNTDFIFLIYAFKAEVFLSSQNTKITP